MEEAVYSVVLLVVISMMLGFIEIPGRYSGIIPRTNPKRDKDHDPEPIPNTDRHSSEITRLRQQFPSRLL